jgi:hypothetical protein
VSDRFWAAQVRPVTRAGVHRQRLARCLRAGVTDPALESSRAPPGGGLDVAEDVNGAADAVGVEGAGREATDWDVGGSEASAGVGTNALAASSAECSACATTSTPDSSRLLRAPRRAPNAAHRRRRSTRGLVRATRARRKRRADAARSARDRCPGGCVGARARRETNRRWSSRALEAPPRRRAPSRARVRDRHSSPACSRRGRRATTPAPLLARADPGARRARARSAALPRRELRRPPGARSMAEPLASDVRVG